MFQIIRLGSGTSRFCNSCEGPARVRLVTCTPLKDAAEEEDRPLAAGLDFCRPCGRRVARGLEKSSAEPAKKKARA